MSISQTPGTLSFSTTHDDLEPAAVISQVVDPDIDAFGEFFGKASGGGPLTKFERDLLRSYIYWKLRGPPAAL